MTQASQSTRAVKTQTPQPAAEAETARMNEDQLLELVTSSLEDDKAEDMVVIDLRRKASFADYMVIANGRSSRQVSAMAQHLSQRLKDLGHGRAPVEGQSRGDWVLIDCGDVVVHLFRPEVREFYGLDKMWIEGFEDDAGVESNPLSH